MLFRVAGLLGALLPGVGVIRAWLGAADGRTYQGRAYFPNPRKPGCVSRDSCSLGTSLKKRQQPLGPLRRRRMSLASTSCSSRSGSPWGGWGCSVAPVVPVPWTRVLGEGGMEQLPLQGKLSLSLLCGTCIVNSWSPIQDFHLLYLLAGVRTWILTVL